MNDLPALPLQHIFSYINNSSCCKNKHDLSILGSNKYMSKFFKDHFEYKFHSYTDLTKYKDHLYINQELIFCNNCSILNNDELNQLDGLIRRYTNYNEINYPTSFSNDLYPSTDFQYYNSFYDF